MYYVCFDCVCVCICICISLFFQLHSSHTTVCALKLRRRLSLCACEYLVVCESDAFGCICKRMYVLMCRCRKERFSIFMHTVCSTIHDVYVYAVSRCTFTERALYLYSTAYRTGILYNMHYSLAAYKHTHVDKYAHTKTHKTRLQYIESKYISACMYKYQNQPGSQPATQWFGV